MSRCGELAAEIRIYPVLVEAVHKHVVVACMMSRLCIGEAGGEGSSELCDRLKRRLIE